MRVNAAAAKSLRLCPTLCDPIDGSPPDSAIPGILQARVLEWVTISFSNAWKWSRSVVSNSSRPHGLQPTMLLRPWDLPGKSTGVGCHCLLRYVWIHISNFSKFQKSFREGKDKYSWPLTTWGWGHWLFPQSEILQWLRVHPSYMWFGLDFNIYYWKESVCRWTCTVQTLVVQ